LPAHFVELRENRSYKIKKRYQRHGICTRTYNHEDEVRGLCVAWVMQGHNPMGMEKPRRRV
jgi:hypothetical protein